MARDSGSPDPARRCVADRRLIHNLGPSSECDHLGEGCQLCPVRFGDRFPLGIAILGSVGAAIYRTRLAEEIPQRVSSAHAEAATDTLGAALEVASGLPGRVGGDLAAAARAAFTSGMRVTAVIAAVISVGVAALIFAIMRPGGRGREARGGAVEASPAAGGSGLEPGIRSEGVER